MLSFSDSPSSRCPILWRKTCFSFPIFYLLFPITGLDDCHFYQLISPLESAFRISCYSRLFYGSSARSSLCDHRSIVATYYVVNNHAHHALAAIFIANFYDYVRPTNCYVQSPRVDRTFRTVTESVTELFRGRTTPLLLGNLARNDCCRKGRQFRLCISWFLWWSAGY